MTDGQLPDVTYRSGPAPGQKKPTPKRKKRSWGRLSLQATVVLLFLVGPVLVGLAIWITDAVGNQEGALAMVVFGVLVCLLQLAAYIPAVVGLVTRDPKAHLGVAAILIGLVVIGLMGMLGYAGLLDLM